MLFVKTSAEANGVLRLLMLTLSYQNKVIMEEVNECTSDCELHKRTSFQKFVWHNLNSVMVGDPVVLPLVVQIGAMEA